MCACVTTGAMGGIFPSQGVFMGATTVAPASHEMSEASATTVASASHEMSEASATTVASASHEMSEASATTVASASHEMSEASATTVAPASPTHQQASASSFGSCAHRYRHIGSKIQTFEYPHMRLVVWQHGQDTTVTVTFSDGFQLIGEFDGHSSDSYSAEAVKVFIEKLLTMDHTSLRDHSVLCELIRYVDQAMPVGVHGGTTCCLAYFKKTVQGAEHQCEGAFASVGDSRIGCIQDGVVQMLDDGAKGNASCENLEQMQFYLDRCVQNGEVPCDVLYYHTDHSHDMFTYEPEEVGSTRLVARINRANYLEAVQRGRAFGTQTVVYPTADKFVLDPTLNKWVLPEGHELDYPWGVTMLIMHINGGKNYMQPLTSIGDDLAGYGPDKALGCHPVGDNFRFVTSTETTMFVASDGLDDLITDPSQYAYFKEKLMDGIPLHEVIREHIPMVRPDTNAYALGVLVGELTGFDDTSVVFA